MLCNNCDKETANRKFCSRSCACSYNNRAVPRRRVEGKCRDCQVPISSKRKRCPTCHESRPGVRESMSLGAIQRSAKYQVNAEIRAMARRVMKRTGLPRVCRACDYSKHVEVSHIRAISTFPPEALVNEINAPGNLEYLCPNHHWEHESGLL